jgi:hypothetical protein
MLNLTQNNNLVELGCRNWWSDKKEARVTEEGSTQEEFLLDLRYSPSNPEPKLNLAPASVFFAIELA